MGWKEYLWVEISSFIMRNFPTSQIPRQKIHFFKFFSDYNGLRGTFPENNSDNFPVQIGQICQPGRSRQNSSNSCILFEYDRYAGQVECGLMKISQTELPTVIPFLFRLFFLV